LSERAFLFDSNVWLALAFQRHPAHAAAINALAHASKAQPACFCRATQQSFLRLASTPAIFKAYGVDGMTNQNALRSYKELIAHPSVSFREEPHGTSSLWPENAGRSTASPKVWMDAYLAAFALAGKMILVTDDRAFETLKPPGLSLAFLGSR
jgi:toxin-antitoxin system PIN domain toxin